MVPRRVASTLLILAATSAAVFGGIWMLENSEQSPTRTATPAPVPTATPSWLTSSGVAHERLAAAHARSLDGRSYTVTTERSVRYANGTLRARTVTSGQVSADHERFTVTVRVRGPYAPVLAYEYRNVTVTFFSDGSTLVQRVVRDGAATYESTPASDDDSADPFFLLPDPSAVAEPFRGVAVEVTGVESPTGDTYRVTGNRVTGDGAFAAARGISEPRNVSFEAVVTADGIVRRYALRYEATFDGAPIRVVRTASYTAVGDTIVPRPTWYDAAMNGTAAPGS